MVHDVALSAGDTLKQDSYAVGGYQLIDHSIDPASKNKIMQGGWNYVVMQGQSQEPVIQQTQFMNGAIAVFQMIKQYNPCAVPLTYMTWGRKNGDPSTCPNFPNMCTYQKMDSVLKMRYINLTSFINGEVSPVSVVWKYLRQNNPGIELYQTDESHPSPAGTYAAACCFYVSIFKKDPNSISFDPALNPGEASIIRNAVKTQIFANLQQYDYKKLPTSKFMYQIGAGNNEAIFTPISQGIQQTFWWNFGDGTTTSTINPVHSYTANGTYTITLTTTTCDQKGLHTSITDSVIQFCSHTPTVATSHSWLCNYDTLWTQPADSYQWYKYGVALPETKQYLPIAKYNSAGVSVLSKSSGCSELSRAFTKTPDATGYYFDAMGDPCKGDTVAFAVLHQKGSLPGSQNIFWFKNGLLLNNMTNKDTLLIFSSGKYECRVTDPATSCPFDTTWSSITYDCGETTGIHTLEKTAKWTVFPNPAANTITVRGAVEGVKMEIFTITGTLIKVAKISAAMTVDISDLPPGMYFVQLRGERQQTGKFVKE